MPLLDEIVELAVDDRGSISVLLRKCLVLAHRLKNDRLKTWAENELNGYQDLDLLPDYRKTPAPAKGLFLGGFGAAIGDQPLPSMVLDEEHRRFAETAMLIQPIEAYDLPAQAPHSPRGSGARPRCPPSHHRADRQPAQPPAAARPRRAGRSAVWPHGICQGRPSTGPHRGQSFARMLQAGHGDIRHLAFIRTAHAVSRGVYYLAGNCMAKLSLPGLAGPFKEATSDGIRPQSERRNAAPCARWSFCRRIRARSIVQIRRCLEQA